MFPGPSQKERSTEKGVVLSPGTRGTLTSPLGRAPADPWVRAWAAGTLRIPPGGQGEARVGGPLSWVEQALGMGHPERQTAGNSRAAGSWGPPSPPTPPQHLWPGSPEDAGRRRAPRAPSRAPFLQRVEGLGGAPGASTAPALRPRRVPGQVDEDGPLGVPGCVSGDTRSPVLGPRSRVCRRM